MYVRDDILVALQDAPAVLKRINGRWRRRGKDIEFVSELFVKNIVCVLLCRDLFVSELHNEFLVSSIIIEIVNSSYYCYLKIIFVKN